MRRFGKSGFGESCDSEVLQRRTVQISQKSMRTSFKRRCGWSGRSRVDEPRCDWPTRFDSSGVRQSHLEDPFKCAVSTQCEASGHCNKFEPHFQKVVLIESENESSQGLFLSCLFIILLFNLGNFQVLYNFVLCSISFCDGTG